MRSERPSTVMSNRITSSGSSSSSRSRSRKDDVASSSRASTYSLYQCIACCTDPTERQRLRGGANINPDAERQTKIGKMSCRTIFTVSVLCYVNVINYMDRFTIAGVLEDVQTAFDIDNDQAGLLQTVFIVSYMIFAPLFGYLGDRYSRRWLMIVGVCLWTFTTLLGSFAQSFALFISWRATVGIGEASYSTLAPAIISDLFVKNLRSNMLALFYFAIPVGSGLGYITGSKAASLAKNWRWSLRVTPIFGVLALLMLFLIKDPERGQSEGSGSMKATSYCTDIKHLITNFSFIFSTLAFSAVAFMTGALAWWGPTFIHLGFKRQPGNDNIELKSVAFVFGCITMIAGLLGVPLGVIISMLLRKRYPAIDPIICGIGMLLSVPILTLACLLVSQNTIITYLLIFFGQLFLNCNWAVNADILLYIVVPTRRATAQAMQILIAHLLGDAGSPYIVGAISIAVRRKLQSSQTRESAQHSLESQNERSDYPKKLSVKSVSARTGQTDDLTAFRSLQYALYCPIFVELLGGLFFLLTACFVKKDRFRANQETLERAKDTEQSK